jgi:DNA-directed RNA polymerase specialized sigma24 family protein
VGTEPERHLSELSTSWTLLHAAHDPDAVPELQQQARRELVVRYLDAARRYLGGALKQQPDRGEAVEELAQEFALKMMDGKMRNASPEQGCFRVFLRTVLSNLVNDYHRRRHKQPLHLGEGGSQQAAPVSEEEFTGMWREQLVQRALGALADHDRKTGQVLSTVLMLTAEEPRPRAAEVAARLSAKLGRPVGEVWVRKRLFQARQKMRELLRREVALSLREPTEEAIDGELAAVGLLAYCR